MVSTAVPSCVVSPKDASLQLLGGIGVSRPAALS